MVWGNSILLLAALLAILLVSVGIEDVRTREIANWKNAAIALLAPFWWVATGLSPWPDMAIQIGIALGIFALFCGAFYLGQMGGGDVKLIGALALWLPAQPLLSMLIVMSLAGGLLTLIMLIDQRLRATGKTIEVPYGVAIAIAGLITLREPVFNQFT